MPLDLWTPRKKQVSEDAGLDEDDDEEEDPEDEGDDEDEDDEDDDPFLENDGHDYGDERGRRGR